SPRSPRRVGRRWREEGRMSHYHDSDDLKLLCEMKTLAPVEFRGFIALDNVVGRDDGTIPCKYRELIALAVACTTQCPIASMRTHATRRQRGDPNGDRGNCPHHRRAARRRRNDPRRARPQTL